MRNVNFGIEFGNFKFAKSSKISSLNFGIIMTRNEEFGPVHNEKIRKHDFEAEIEDFVVNTAKGGSNYKDINLF